MTDSFSDKLRLLVHGGNSYNERRRIGAWLEVSRGVLEDKHGLNSDVPVFGLGLLEDREPFLIVRRRESTSGVRVYAYSLLLDPGREVWGKAKFDWNAAALADALFASPGSPGNIIFAQPEKIDQNALVEQLNSLSPPKEMLTSDDTRADVMNDDDAARNLRALWVGASLAAETVVAPAQNFGFDTRPTPAQIARLLDTLPPCFRCGLGWLVGGSRGHAQAFGAKLLLDTDLNPEDTTLDDCLARGSRLLEAWETVTRYADFRSEIEERSKTPLWDWERVHGSSLSEFAPRLALLASLLEQPSSVSDDALAELEQTLARDGSLESELRRAAHASLRASVSADGGLFSPAATRLLLSEHFVGKINAADLVTSFDRAALVNYFVEQDRHPDEKKCGLKLSHDAKFAIWRERAARAETAADAVKELFDALGSLAYAADSQHKDAHDELISEVFDARASTAPLAIWDRLANRVGGVIVPDKIKQEARARIQTRSRSNGWEREYLLYAQDDGGTYLAEHDAELALSRSELDALVERFIRLADSGDRDDAVAADRARRWLQQLHESKLRSKLSLDTKLALLQRAPNEWRDLEYLWKLYHLKDGDGKIAKPKIFPQFIPFLREELGGLTERKPQGVPDLVEIVALLDDIAVPVRKQLGKWNISLNWVTLERWRGGWEKLGEHKFARGEVAWLLKHSNTLPKNFSFEDYDFDEASIEKLFADLIYGDEASDETDSQHSTILRQLLERYARANRVRAAVAKAIADLLDSADAAKAFARRFVFAGRRIVLNLIFEFLIEAEADELMRRVARLEPEGFEWVAGDIYKDIEPVFWKSGRDQGGVNVRHSDIVKTNELTKPYQFALIRFMRSAEAKAARKSVAHDLPGWGDNYELVHARFNNLNDYIRQKVGDADARDARLHVRRANSHAQESMRRTHSSDDEAQNEINDQHDADEPPAENRTVVVKEVETPNIITRKWRSIGGRAREWWRRQNDVTPAAESSGRVTEDADKGSQEESVASNDGAQKDGSDEETPATTDVATQAARNAQPTDARTQIVSASSEGAAE
jgi:hypothetical protein